MRGVGAFMAARVPVHIAQIWRTCSLLLTNRRAAMKAPTTPHRPLPPLRTTRTPELRLISSRVRAGLAPALVSIAI